MAIAIDATAGRLINPAGRSSDYAVRRHRRGLALLLSRALRAIAERLRRRRAVARLQALDDRVLKDIGVYRGEIPFRVSHR